MSRLCSPVPRRLRQTWPLLGVLVLGLGSPQRGTFRGPAQQPDPKALFTKLCAVCHGQTGGGDGPAAAALTPRPASFARPEFQAARTDEQFTTAISAGKAPMPAFGKQLTLAEIRSLVAYVRALGRQAKKP